jgi:outer membrane protein TolC
MPARWVPAFVALALWRPAAAGAQAPAVPDTLRMSLAACVERALTVGEEMRIVEAEYEAARGTYVRARSDALPQLTLGTTYTRQFESVFESDAGGFEFEPFEPDTTASLEERVRDLERALPEAPLGLFSGLFESGPFASKNAWVASASLTQTLFEGGSVWGAIQAAGHGLKAVENRRRDHTLEVELQTREAYLAALLAERGVRIAELGLEQADTQLQRVRLRQEAGQAAEFDLLQAEVQRGNQLPAVLRARNQRDVASLQLRGLANLPVGVPLVLTTPLLDEGALPADPAAVDTLGLMQAALEAAGVVALAEELEAREHAISVAARDRWPGMALFANYSEQAFPEDVFPSRGDWRRDANAGVRLYWSIFDGLRTRGMLQESRAQRSIARQNLLQAREGVNLLVAQNVGELQRSAAEVRARARTVALAWRTLELANLRYEEGASSLLEVQDARLGWQLAQTYEAQARHDYFAALARLERYTGRPLFTSLAPRD